MYGKAANIPIAAQNPVSLVGKSVLVVGGTAGLGRAIAEACINAGASVTTVGRSNRGGGGAFVPCDVSLMGNVRKLVADLPVETFDVLAFTNGIIPKKTKCVTSEGVEEDMAVSALSRHVFLAAAAPRFKAGVRVLIWGMPGNGMVKHADGADLNSDAKYGGGFSPPTHANTIALNEALVAHWAAKGVVAAGFNPGLVRTDIRNVLHGGTGCMAAFFEGCIGCFNPTAEVYAQAVLPLLTAPELAAQKGLLFGQKGTTIQRSPELEGAADVQRWIDAADALAAKAIAASGAEKTTLRVPT